jgi:hypothetical protein
MVYKNINKIKALENHTPVFPFIPVITGTS